MPTPIVMPQMGESIAEGTIVRWMKKVGDPVDRDEPLFEITTDKVDAEIPSPAAGVLAEITAREGETVAVNAVVGTIRVAGEDTPPQPAAPSADAPVLQPEPQTPSAAAAAAVAASPAPAAEDQPRRKSSPLVRRIARDNHVDLGRVSGSGQGGRVTKRDILQFLERQSQPTGQPAGIVRPSVSGAVDIRPMSPIRKKIAEHMVLSRRTSAHVHSVFHVDFTNVDRIRREKKEEYAGLGARLTFMGFIAKAVIDAIRSHPILNSSLDGDNIIVKRDVHLGIAVALETGLIVPVIRNAGEMNLLGLCRAIADVADRARAKQLKPDEVHDGTFTITNPGQLGAQFGLPIINQPQVAILCVGTIEKRPVIVDDAIAIRTMSYLTLGFDHRLIDGAVADQFMADVRHNLEHFDSNTV